MQRNTAVTGRMREARGSDSAPAVAAAAAARASFNDLVHVPISIPLGSFRADAIYWGVWGQRWWRNYLHAHSFFEVCYVFRGRGSFTLDGQKHAVTAGDVFVARPFDSHEIVSSRREPLQIYFWAYTLVPMLNGQHASPADASIDALVQNFITSPRSVARGGESIQRTLEAMTEEMARRSAGYSQALAALALKLVLDVARLTARGTVASEHVDPPARTSGEVVVRTAVQYLRDNLSRRIELRDVAAQVQLSPRQLSRLFQKTTGTSVIDYLTELRIETASQLLLNRDLPIKQVARAVGYPNTHYFTTLFRRRTGTTPAAFRDAGGTKFFQKPSR